MSQEEQMASPPPQVENVLKKVHKEEEAVAQGEPQQEQKQAEQEEKSTRRLSSGTESESGDDDDDAVGPCHVPAFLVARQAAFRGASPMLTTQATENDNFEDAIDAASPIEASRSLTNRSLSASRASPRAPDNEPLEKSTDEAHVENSKNAELKADSDSDSDEDDSDEESAADLSEVESLNEMPVNEKPADRRKSVMSYRISNTSNLDNVSLDDDGPAQQSPPLESKSPKEEQQATIPKTLSLNSITNSLPSLPWSPPSDSPPKSPVPPAAAVAPPPPPPPPPQTAPPSRKLTSPFSWLSRNSSKEKELPPPPPQSSTRRNTASSIATLTSNPEMMLSRLEEEGDVDSASVDGARRSSLRDRFKQLRLQGEGAQPSEGDEDETGATKVTGLGITTGVEVPAGEKPLPSPVPDPTTGLAPGTASGVNVGLSSISETNVDWDLWQSVVYEGPTAVARTSAEELNKAIATGIPSAIRGVIWQVLANSKNDDLEAVYKGLSTRGTDKSRDRHSNGTTASSLSNGNLSVQSGEAIASSASSVTSDNSGSNGLPSPNAEKNSEAILKAQAAAAAERKKKEKEDAANLQKLEKTIRRDLGARTSYSKYAAAAGLQEGLFGVCKAYALFDEGVGYAQGMNFLIMPLLFNMPEQEAFCLLVRLMNHYKLRDLFIQDMPGLHMHLYQFERLLEDFEPALYCHLHRRGITSHLYATQWFLTLFAYRFPLQLVLRIYDLILSEGLSAILRFGIVLMQKNATTLLGLSDMQQLTTYLKDKLFDVYIDKDPSHGSLLDNGFFGSSSSSMDKDVYHADQLVKDACEVKITPELLKSYTVEWEEKTRMEKEREEELQELRAANHNLAIRVRRLEERVEVCDREQTDLATELVHTKVDNEELRDENESMKGQVRELRIVIEKQPEELEGTWKLEREELMKANLHQHEENQRLEKEMSELEEELVSTKLQYAEINSQHETLNRKWSDLKRQFA